ncbi:lactonase family protein [Lactobacillus sp. PV037]|uniref:lactonase family protein n=1 Tax=unclassified Lactobacillus TaxID=2620435 RepID=UPI00223F7857|nr:MULTISPECIES: lactonase family protein [unclassified Lactobacillus]QNQ82583.1 lactonase family protein [Lactobacillus sp. PV012]QNQ83302.1 lactonase family protein [Lactobacillus sp. PV037]
MEIWFGGYTSHTSKGIYLGNSTQEGQHLKISKIDNLLELKRPTYFQISSDNLLFSIIEKDGQAGIASFNLNTNPPAFIDAFLHDGAAPCYVGLNEDKHLIYTANYHLATINVFSYDNQGKLTFITSTHHTGQGPLPEQASAHPHFFDETPDGNLVSCDLGLDQVEFYQLENKELTSVAKYQLEPGFGVRHLTFSPDGKFMFIVGELSSQVHVAKFNEKNWAFEAIGTYSTIPNFEGKNGAAAIRISKDGKFLYVSNRGDNSLVVFKVFEDGKLEMIQRISTFGAFPRDFNWSNDQRYVIAVNQNSDNATLYKRNSKLGTLTPLQKNITVPEATRIIFKED